MHRRAKTHRDNFRGLTIYIAGVSQDPLSAEPPQEVTPLSGHKELLICERGIGTGKSLSGDHSGT
jgi:hypothetical protein